MYEIPDQDGVRYSFMHTYDPSKVTDSRDLTDIFEARAPVEFFGQYWTDQLATGYRAIQKLDSDQYLEMAFEDLFDDTEGSLECIADFFEFEGDRSKARKRAAEQQSLREACPPGMRQLGRTVSRRSMAKRVELVARDDLSNSAPAMSQATVCSDITRRSTPEKLSRIRMADSGTASREFSGVTGITPPRPSHPHI